MKSVQIVAPGHILGVWEIVWPMLNVAFINYEHGDYDIEQLKVLLIKEFQIETLFNHFKATQQLLFSVFLPRPFLLFLAVS